MLLFLNVKDRLFHIDAAARFKAFVPLSMMASSMTMMTLKIEDLGSRTGTTAGMSDGKQVGRLSDLMGQRSQLRRCPQPHRQPVKSNQNWRDWVAMAVTLVPFCN